jgi:D-glycero-alpha-D-manno-heptose-7-phosphate kinase
MTRLTMEPSLKSKRKSRLLITRAPLTLSLAGGGTDLEAYYSKYGGAVLSASIDRYCYVFASPSACQHIQVASSDYQTFYGHLQGRAVLDGDLRLPKLVTDHFGIHAGLSLFLASEVPPDTGLGSESTVTVALIAAMAALAGKHLNRQAIAELACQIEIEKLGMPLGKEDQYAASFGGLNYFTFQSGLVAVEPLKLSQELLRELERRLMLFFTRRSRNPAEILTEQKRSSERNRASVIEALHVTKETAVGMYQDLRRGEIGAIGDWLHRSWIAKRRLARGMSDPWIDQWYEEARAAGASGGKIAGAGGGGFLLLFCEPEHQERVTTTLERSGLAPMDFRFESSGATVIMNTLLEPSDAVARPAHA